MYPDLAGRLAKLGQLGVESTKEHSAAKLDQMSSDEKTEMANLNQKYKNKFGFPFIICVRLNKKEAIFSGLRSRLHNDHDQELQNGIKEVLKITELRIRDLIFDDSNKIMSKIWFFLFRIILINIQKVFNFLPQASTTAVHWMNKYVARYF